MFRCLLIAVTLYAGSLHARTKPKLLLQLGHTDDVVDADLFRAGKALRVLTISKDGRLKVWDGRDGAMLSDWKWKGQRKPAQVTVARGGKTAVVWSRLREPMKLNLTTGEQTPIALETRGAIEVVCRSRDRRKVALQSGKQPVRLYTLPDLRQVGEVPVVVGRMKHCRFGVRDRVLALGDGRGYVSWFDLRKNLAPVDRRQIDSLLIDGMDESPKGNLWIIKGRKHEVLWDLAARAEKGRWRAGGSNGFVRFSRDGKHVIRGGHGSKALRYVDPMTGKRSFEVPDDLQVPKGRLDTFRWLAAAGELDELLVLRRRKDTMVEVWNGDKGQRLTSLWGHPQHITSIAFYEDNRHLAVGNALGRVERWDLLSGAHTPLKWDPHRSAVTAIAFSRDGAWVATGDARGNVFVRERKTGRLDRKLRAGSRVERLQFLADSKTLLMDGGSPKLLRVDNGFEMPLPKGLRGRDHLVWSPDDKRVAYTTGNRIIVRRGDKELELKGRAKVASLAFTSKGKQLLVATKDGELLTYDATSGKPIGAFKSAPDGDPQTQMVWLGQSGHLMAGLGPDAVVRFWAKGDTEPRLMLLIDEQNEYIVWNSDGAFDASQGGGKYVAWRVGKRVYPVDRFREKYQIPGLMGLRLSRKARKVTVGDLGREFRPPPTVQIVSPEPNASTEDDLVSVSVEVADTGGGIAEIRLYHQGRLVENVRKGLGGAEHQRRKFDVLLEPGRNRLWATALSDGRVESKSAPVDVVYGKRNERVRLRVLSVGINKYRDQALALKYAAADATALSAALSKPGGRLFKGGVEHKVLLDEKAGRKGVRDGFKWLIENTRAADVAVVYLAGHGETVGDEYYFVPQDLAFTSLDALKAGGISQTELQDLIRRVPARKLVVLLDTCKSGAVSLGFATRGLAEKKALSVLGQASGIYLVAASTSRQLALEDKDLGHGLFTWSLLRGLEGKADIDGDKAVTVRELVTFLEAEVARVSKSTFGQEQFPVTHGTGRNFPLALIR